MLQKFQKKNETENKIVIPKLINKFLKKKIKCKMYYLPQNYPKLSGFNKFQEGYRYHAMTNESFTSDKPGEWQNSWYVIAQNEMDDPYFVNFEEENLGFPVYFAGHGCGKWNAIKVTSGIEQFAEILVELNALTPPCTIDFLSNRVDISNEFWSQLADEMSYPEDEE